MPIRVLVITSARYAWALHPFAYLFKRYWSELQPVLVCGYGRIPDGLPPSFEFFKIAEADYPQDMWSTGLIKVLTSIPDQHVIIMLEDYWLCRTVDARGVQACSELAQSDPTILRFDLTDDRQYAGDMHDLGAYGSYDIVETPSGSPYQLSLQSAIWNKHLLLQVLQPNKSAWEVEMHTSPPGSMRVFGTRQCPVRYANVVLKGSIQKDQIERIPTEHRDIVRNMIPKEWSVHVP